jgi:protein dithiol oxidoreductase (disulfide-forming)
MRGRGDDAKLNRRRSGLMLLAVLLLPTPLLAQARFQAGHHYQVVATPEAAGLAKGKIEVTEAFSYLCVHCFEAQGLVEQIRAALPADAAVTYVHAGFNQGWQLLQRAHITAQQLGIADRNHARVFAAIWETGELPFMDRTTGRPLQPAPTLRDVARFYVKGSAVTEAAFLAKANSAEVNDAVKRVDALIKGWQIAGTPGFVVAGRYRIEMGQLKTLEELNSLVGFLVGLERDRLKKAAAPKKG